MRGSRNAGNRRTTVHTFSGPLLQVEFRLRGHWQIAALRPLSLGTLPEEEETAFFDALHNYLQRPWRRPRSTRVPRYDVAILHDPDATLAPSNRLALGRFVRAGRKLGADVKLIQARDRIIHQSHPEGLLHIVTPTRLQRSSARYLG